MAAFLVFANAGGRSIAKIAVRLPLAFLLGAERRYACLNICGPLGKLHFRLMPRHVTRQLELRFPSNAI